MRLLIQQRYLQCADSEFRKSHFTQPSTSVSQQHPSEGQNDLRCQPDHSPNPRDMMQL